MWKKKQLIKKTITIIQAGKSNDMNGRENWWDRKKKLIKKQAP